jgi:uncharacterized protein
MPPAITTGLRARGSRLIGRITRLARSSQLSALSPLSTLSPQPSALSPIVLALSAIVFALLLSIAAAATAADLPELVAPVNDFAHVIDSRSAAQIDQLSRALKQASGDVVVVATVQTIEPYGDIREYAVKLFENHGRGIGDKGKDNGLLILLAVKERKVWVEVGYGLEEWITDGYSGETSRQYMVPQFRNGNYGLGLLAGTARIVNRIAEGRQVTLEGVARQRDAQPDGGASLWHFFPILIFIAILIISRIGGGRGGRGRGLPLWALGSTWSGWSSGVGSFGGGGGGWGGGGGGGFGGGFGGFGGGGSGGGGGGASW